MLVQSQSKTVFPCVCSLYKYGFVDNYIKFVMKMYFPSVKLLITIVFTLVQAVFLA